ncbi:MAG: TIGR03619 family F420-dependent LLM class oxidoreductase [Candidatus Binatia bacterium]
MDLGLYVRNMGPQSTRGMLVDCARAADQAGIDHLWVADHIAIPPDQSEGSGGRYLDPLATLAFLAAVTDRIRLGTGVLVLPYRPLLATAKWLATIQELSGERLLFGVGAGWMEAEFRVVGVARERRGTITDRTLEFVHRCFAADEVEEAGQRFLFLPRPKRPPIYVGGAGRAVLQRAARFGEGWMPGGGDPQKLAASIGELAKLFADAGKPAPEVIALTTLPLDDPEKAVDRARALARVGVTGIVHASRYASAAELARNAEVMAARVRPKLESE